MRSNFRSVLSLVTLLFLFTVGIVGIQAQSIPTDYLFLSKFTKVDLQKWAESKSKDELIKSARYLIGKSESALNKNDLMAAVKFADTSLTVAQYANDPFVLGKIKYQKGLIFVEMGNPENRSSAVTYLKEARAHLKDATETEAKVYLGIVTLLLADFRTEQGSFSEAIPDIYSSYKLAIDSGSKRLLGLTFKSLGLYFFYQEKYPLVLACFEKAQDLLDVATDSGALLDINRFSNYLFSNLGIREEVFESQQKSEELLKHSYSKRKEIAYLYSKAYFLNGNGYSLRSIKLYEFVQKAATEIGDHRFSQTVQYAIGKTFLLEGDFKSAEIELREVIQNASRPNTRDDDLVRLSKIGLADSLEGQGKTEDARKLFLKVESDLGTLEETQYLFYKSYANFLITQNDYINAKKYLELKSKIFMSPYGPIYTEIARLWLDYKTDKTSSDEVLRRLSKLTSNIKNEQLNSNSTGSNINYLDGFVFPFRLTTLIHFEKSDYITALLAADGYKSRWLSNKIVSGKSFGVTNKNWIVSDEAKALRDKIFQRLMVSGIKGEEKSDTELQALLKTHDEKLNQRQDISTLTKKFEKTELSREEFKDLTSQLSNITVLSYAFTSEYLVAFIIQQGQPVRAIKIDVKENFLKDKIEKWRNEIVSRDLGFKKESREIYDLLIKPIESEIEDASQLVIIPEGILWKVPFQALLDSRQQYLIQKIPVGYAPSLKVLHTLQNRKASSEVLSVFAFGNPRSNSARKLPESEFEAKNTAAIYSSGKYFIGADATETALKDALTKADILHLAVHGRLDETDPMRSSIAMSKDTQNDGNFEIEEIIGLPRSPELVVLSACSTNDGQVFNGEGLLSLSWAFLAAGSKNVVGTQWEIDDKTTSEEMQLFHLGILKKEGVAKSLRNAATKQIEKKGIQNHPFYWAGFVSLGGF